LWAVHNQGFPDQASGGNPGDQAAIAHEVDWFIVNFDPDTGQEGSPPLVNHLELMYRAVLRHRPQPLLAIHSTVRD
jgi:hypothetical protein